MKQYYDFREIAHIMHLKPKTILVLFWQGILVAEPDIKIQDRSLFSVESIRNYALKHRVGKKIRCLSCSRAVIGDVFCHEHLPSGMPVKPSIPDKVEIACTTNARKEIGAIFKNYMSHLGLASKDVMATAKSSESQISKFSSGKRKVLDLEKISDFFGAIGFTVRLVIEKKQHDERN